VKLLICPDCGDLFNLTEIEKTCTCGFTRGRYVDNLNAVYSGGIPLGFANSTFVNAVRSQPQSGRGREFTAFVIPKECPTFKEQKPMYLVDVLVKQAGLSTSVARRVIVQGAVKVDTQIADNPGAVVPVMSEVEYDGRVYPVVTEGAAP
jgi:hypothetical protein